MLFAARRKLSHERNTASSIGYNDSPSLVHPSFLSTEVSKTSMYPFTVLQLSISYGVSCAKKLTLKKKPFQEPVLSIECIAFQQNSSLASVITHSFSSAGQPGSLSFSFLVLAHLLPDISINLAYRFLIYLNPFSFPFSPPQRPECLLYLPALWYTVYAQHNPASFRTFLFYHVRAP